MDELVQGVVCYNPRPLLLHGYLMPFFVLQAVVYYSCSLNQYSEPIDEQVNNQTTLADSIDEHAKRHSYELGVIAITVSIAAQIITYLFCHWSVDVKCWLSYSKCNNPAIAKYAKVTPTLNNGSTELVPLKREVVNQHQQLWFEFQKTKYVYDIKSATFKTIEFPIDRDISFYKRWAGYSDPNEMQMIDQLYGRNELEMIIPKFKELFIERATAPFFVFQVFCVGLWFMDEYWHYAMFTLFMLVAFEVLLVKHQLRNMQEIRRMGNKPFQVQVFRQNKWKPIGSDQLLNGDLVGIARSENNIPCDLLLVRGSCIIDESTLTGESVPQMKEPLESLEESDRPLNVGRDKLHIIYGGTKVLQHTPSGKDQFCVGYVLRTGFQTSQGKLLRTILFGVKRVTANNFESFCFIMFLMVFAIMSACYVWNKGIQDPKRSRYRLFFECTIIITSVIPPELPIELSLAVNTSLLSLSRLYIYCTEPFRIPFAGKVEYCCFDKTGTLTSDDLIVEGVAGLPEIVRDENEENLKPMGELVENIKSNTNKESISIKNGQVGVDDLAKSFLSQHKLVTPIDRCTQYTLHVLASCHSLAHLDEKLVGDPLERKVLEAINWNYSKSGVVSPKKGRIPPLKIHQRFHFNSTLKRMAVIASYKLDMSNDNIYICTAKGAPEFIRPLLKQVPDNYDDVYLEMSRSGARVLALGYKTLGALSHGELAQLKRDDVEKDLMFAGFLLISCPLKPDSKSVAVELVESGHRLVMITGDGALTACHVASLLNFVTKPVLILTQQAHDDWNWLSTDRKISKPCAYEVNELKELYEEYDLCLTGDSLDYIHNNFKDNLIYETISRIKVFARTSPKQKETIITSLKSRGKTVLMCGDGTNDVGALKHAHVGVALLSSSGPPPKAKPDMKQIMQNMREETAAKQAQYQAQVQQYQQQQQQLQAMQRKGNKKSANQVASPTLPTPMSPAMMAAQQRREAQAQLRKLIEDQEGPQFVKLGDASIAAPFTSRLSSTRCISHIIKQGRCTLVTTMQMFKILALNALLSAYCHSVLYLDGIKFSDGQSTVHGLLSTMCFLFITRSQPLDKLSSLRPLPNIFNLYTILTVTLQFAVHFGSLVYLYDYAKTMQGDFDVVANSTTPLPVGSEATGTLALESNATLPAEAADSTGMHTEFKPSLVNSTVYLIWLSIQISTFLVNYKGHPFMQSLRTNKQLCYLFMGSIALVFAIVNGWSPSLADQLSIVDLPIDFRPILLSVIVLDCLVTFAIDRVCEFFFGRLTLQPL